MLIKQSHPVMTLRPRDIREGTERPADPPRDTVKVSKHCPNALLRTMVSQHRAA